MGKFNLEDNDVLDETMVEESMPTLVIYHKQTNEAVIYKGQVCVVYCYCAYFVCFVDYVCQIFQIRWN